MRVWMTTSLTAKASTPPISVQTTRRWAVSGPGMSANQSRKTM
jgi:hypothetical protein